MISKTIKRSSSLALILIWVVTTAGISFLVARYEANSSAGGSPAISLPIAFSQRSTVKLATYSVQPVISGDGVVVASGPNFVLEAPIIPSDRAYRLLNAPVGVRALIVGGPAGFDCIWLGIAIGQNGVLDMRCQLPPDVAAVAGLSGTMVLQLSAATDALTLPVTAVVGTAQRGQVIVVEADGTGTISEVGIGISDAFRVEITSGLGVDEIVLENPVQSDFSGSSG